ncbi:MAG: hypothetical protein IKC52_04635, partial [Clostridia bacterium]|nr:hypothetical protein [Clostridia bacterium]
AGVKEGHLFPHFYSVGLNGNLTGTFENGQTITLGNKTFTIQEAYGMPTLKVEVTAPAHECESKCPECGLCLDAECTEEACANKCQGHHVCESICPECGLCLDAECTDPACANKCQGHHKCESICPLCGGCLDSECTDSACANKCQGGHVDADVVEYTSVTIAVEDGKLLLVYSGNYGADFAQLATLEERFASDFARPASGDNNANSLQRLNGDWKYVWEAIDKEGTKHYTVVAEGGKFQVKCDISSILFKSTDILYGHFLGENMAVPFVEATVELNGLEVRIGAANSDCPSWMSGLSVIYAKSIGTATVTNVHLEAIEGKAYYIVEGTFENYTQSAVEAFRFDLEVGGVDAVAGLCKATYNEDGTFKVVADISGVTPDGALLYPHLYTGFTMQDVIGGVEGETITVGGKIYTITIKWDMPVLIVTEAPHACESICPECGLCLDAECAEEVCAEKCQGHVITSIEEALAAEDGVAVELVGTVTGHNNYKSNFYIQDEAGKEIYVYYATSDVNIGDVVKVVGVVGSYNGAKQIAKGSTVTVVTAHECANKCPECGGCLDAECSATVCETKCAGHEAGSATATLSFSDKANRTTFTTSQQVWQQDGIVLTNDKASSTSNVADYSNPARFYKSSKITITAPGAITKIVFDCNSSSYATALKSSIGTVAGATVTVSSDKVTVEFTEAVDSFVIASLSGGQVRMDGLTVVYEPAA